MHNDELTNLILDIQGNAAIIDNRENLNDMVEAALELEGLVADLREGLQASALYPDGSPII